MPPELRPPTDPSVLPPLTRGERHHLEIVTPRPGRRPARASALAREHLSEYPDDAVVARSSPLGRQ